MGWLKDQVRKAGASLRGVRTGGDNRAARRAARQERRSLRRATRRAARQKRIETRQNARTARKGMGGGFGGQVANIAEKLSNSYLEATGQQAMPEGKTGFDMNRDLGLAPEPIQSDYLGSDSKKSASMGIIAVVVILALWLGFNKKNKLTPMK